MKDERCLVCDGEGHLIHQGCNHMGDYIETKIGCGTCMSTGLRDKEAIENALAEQHHKYEFDARRGY